MLDRVNKINPVKAWIYAIDKNVREEIVLYNTEDQLWSDGVDSLGNDLGDYQPVTVDIKRSKGQRTDHITLKDTGEFYDSFKVTVQKDSFTINADPQKDDTNLFDEFGIDIVGLTDENMKGIMEYIVENYQKYLHEQLL